jgi:hypothetical protein
MTQNYRLSHSIVIEVLRRLVYLYRNEQKRNIYYSSREWGSLFLKLNKKERAASFKKLSREGSCTLSVVGVYKPYSRCYSGQGRLCNDLGLLNCLEIDYETRSINSVNLVTTIPALRKQNIQGKAYKTSRPLRFRFLHLWFSLFLPFLFPFLVGKILS